MKPFIKRRTVEIEVDINKSVIIQIEIRREEDGQLTIFTKIGTEPLVSRATSIFNPNIVQDMK